MGLDCLTHTGHKYGSNKEDAVVADELGMRGRKKQCPFDILSRVVRKHARLMNGMPVGCIMYIGFAIDR